MGNITCQLTWFLEKMRMKEQILNVFLKRKCDDLDVIIPDISVVEFFFYFTPISSQGKGNFPWFSGHVEFSKASGLRKGNFITLEVNMLSWWCLWNGRKFGVVWYT